MLVAVEESATATGKGNGETAATRRVLATRSSTQQHSFALRSIALAALVLLGVAPAFTVAQIVPGGANAPGVITTPNGLNQVNINRPSGAGVSVNTYNQFDVQQRGAILNNSPTIVPTQQAGMINGNPNFAPGQSARIIVNQVNSGAASQINGYLEVAGQKAQVVIANLLRSRLVWAGTVRVITRVHLRVRFLVRRRVEHVARSAIPIRRQHAVGLIEECICGLVPRTRRTALYLPVSLRRQIVDCLIDRNALLFRVSGSIVLDPFLLVRMQLPVEPIHVVAFKRPRIAANHRTRPCSNRVCNNIAQRFIHIRIAGRLRTGNVATQLVQLARLDRSDASARCAANCIAASKPGHERSARGLHSGAR